MADIYGVESGKLGNMKASGKQALDIYTLHFPALENMHRIPFRLWASKMISYVPLCIKWSWLFSLVSLF